MGVDRNDYIVIGYKMPYDVKFKNGELLCEDIWDDEKYIPMIEGWKDEEFTIISDGMSGKYIAFGKMIDSSDEYQGFDFIELNIDQADFDKVKQRAKEIFPELEFDFETPKTLIFSHYS